MNNTRHVEIALTQIPRMLSLGDRNSYSPTYGCFDRYFWHYKLTDFANARFQEASLVLAMLYKNKFEGNIYFRNTKIKKLAEASIRYWSKIQLKDGSLDEVYPFEHSFVGTSFSTYAITESMLILNLKKYAAAVRKAGDWLANESNYQVSNQVAGAIAALNNIAEITGDAKYREAAEKKLHKLLQLQHKSGYFPEYCGWDVGYLSICIKYLSRYYLHNPTTELGEALRRASTFLNKKLKDDCSYDNTHSSRKTQYLYPSGFAILNNKTVLSKNIRGLTKNRILNPSWMDDRFFIPLTSDYLETYLFQRTGGKLR